MELPEEERAVLKHSVVNLQSGLRDLISLIDRFGFKDPDAREVVVDNIKDLTEHADKARSVVDMIIKGVFD